MTFLLTVLTSFCSVAGNTCLRVVYHIEERERVAEREREGVEEREGE